MKYSYTRQGNQLRFKYCPICNKVKENPDFTINIAEGVYFCFSNNIGGRVEDLSKYGFDIGEIPELRRFYRVETKNNGSLRGDNPLNSKDSSLNGDIKKYYKEEGKNSKDFARDIENKNRCLGGEIPQDFKDGSLGGDKTLSNDRANNFTDNNSFNKRRVENSWTSDSKESKNYKSKKNIDLTSIFIFYVSSKIF